MFLQGVFLAALVTFKMTHSLPLEEKIDPVEMNYRCIHPGTNRQDKNPVLMMHGFLDSLETWDGISTVLALQTKRKVCVVDLRNHGESPLNNRSDIAALAVDVGNFLDKQNIKKVNLIGHSFGGKTAIHYTLNNPDRVESIVVEDMRSNGIRKSLIYLARDLIRYFERLVGSLPVNIDADEAKWTIINFINEILEKMGAADRLPKRAFKILDLELIDGKWRSKNNFNLAIQLLKDPDYIFTESSGLYMGPAMFIYGTESPLKVEDDTDNILKLFPRAMLVPVEGSGHIIHGVHHEFEDAVIKFLNEIN